MASAHADEAQPRD